MSEIFYDAFISYRHTELDSYIAEKLHGMLEHYRIPKKIQETSGKKKITRIFRDQEELPLSADLSFNIKTALEHSEFLIVICSPEAVESRWIKTEIETFLKTHSKDRVLTILVRGEPQDAFPEILCCQEQTIVEDGIEKIVQIPIEPLAADVRADSKEKSGKKLKKELLRILAPMLSCTFDDLRQRQKEYKTKWIIRSLAAVVLVAVAFGIYAARQAAAIEAQYQASRRNQARYLCNVSDQLLNSGDRVGALQTALAIQTEDGKEALVPEQMYALNNALYSYQNINGIYQEVACELEIEHPVMRSYSSNARRAGYVADFSPEGTYLFVLDKIGNAYVFDSSTGECRYCFKAADFAELSGESFREGIPVSENEILLLTETCVVTVDIEKQQLVKWKIDDTTNLSVLNYKIQGQRIVFGNSFQFAVYDYISGEKLLEGKKNLFSWDENAEHIIEVKGDLVDMALSPSAKQLAAVFAPSYGEEDATYVMRVFALDTGEYRSWEIENFDKENSIVFVDEEHIASLWINEIENEYSLESYRPYSYGVYELSTGTLLWKQEIYGVIADFTKGILKVASMERVGAVDGVLEPMVITCMGNQIQVTLAETGEVLSHATATHAVIGVEKIDSTRMFVATTNGDIYVETTTTKGGLPVTTSCRNEISEYKYASESGTSVIIGMNGQPLLFYRAPKDEHMMEMKLDVSSIYCNLGKDGVYSVFLTDSSDAENQRMVVRNQKTDEILGEIEAKEPHQEMEIVGILSKDDQAYALYVTKSADYKVKEPQTLTYQNLQTGEIIYRKTLENIPGNEESTSYDEFEITGVYGENSHAVIYSRNGNYFKIIDYTSGEMVVPFQCIEQLEDFEMVYLYQVEASEDGKYFIFSGNVQKNETVADRDERIQVKSWFVKLWDIEQKQWKSYDQAEGAYLKLQENVKNEFYSDNFILGTRSMNAAVYPEENEILIVDLLSGEVTQTIPYSGKNGCHMAFFDEERYLLFLGDDGHLTMWDLVEERIVMKDTETLVSASAIYVDNSHRYFGIRCSNGMGTLSDFIIYSVDEAHQFYRFANIGNGFASFQNEEVYSFGVGDSFYYTSFYDYDTLKERAKEILQDRELTEEELRRYYISEN